MRTATGDWWAAVRVAVWPLGLVFLLACGAGIISHPDLEYLEIGWGLRMRVALAAVLHGLGGGFGVATERPLGIMGDQAAGSATVTCLPLLVTAAWSAALALATRRVRAPSVPAGYEAALRIGAVCAAGAFLLALYARPSYEGIVLTSVPWRTLLCSFALSAAVAAAVLTHGRTSRDGHPASGPRRALAALRTALLALVVVLALATATAPAVLLTTDAWDIPGEGLAGLLVLLPNLGALALAYAWGAPVSGHAWGTDFPPERVTYDYGTLAEAAGGWALAGAFAGGVLCALVFGVLSARRSADRREHLLAAAFFALAVLLLVALAGGHAHADFRDPSATVGGGPGDRSGEVFLGDAAFGAGGAELFLFTLLWTAAGALLAPYVLALFRVRTFRSGTASRTSARTASRTSVARGPASR